MMGSQAGGIEQVSAEIAAHHRRVRARLAIDQMFRDGLRPRRFTGCPAETEALGELRSLPWPALCARARG